MKKKFLDNEFSSWLDGFLNFEKLPQKNMFWLDMMQNLCALFNNPQNGIPCFHVAGSKGKGSVSKMIACILDEYVSSTTTTSPAPPVALYTSPHLINFRERITAATKFFPEYVYEKVAKTLMQKVTDFTSNKNNAQQDRQITWFELVTVFAFLCAKESHSKYSVYEVGLGGRLDATNVVNPLISVINTIELEHTEYLGNTIEKIAKEKAGIIKEDGIVLCANQTQEATLVLKEVAKEKKAKIYFLSDVVQDIKYEFIKNDFNQNIMQTSIKSPLFTRPLNARLKLLGSVQAQNAALASCAVKLVLPKVTEEEIEKGLEKATLHARFEILEKTNYSPIMVLDGAHTVNSIKTTLETFKSIFAKHTTDKKSIHLLFACAQDKNVDEIAQLFNEFNTITLTRPGNAKMCDSKKMESAFNTARSVLNKNLNNTLSYNDDYELAIKNAMDTALQNDAILLVTGSFYLCAEVIKLLNMSKK